MPAPGTLKIKFDMVPSMEYDMVPNMVPWKYYMVPSMHPPPHPGHPSSTQLNFDMVPIWKFQMVPFMHPPRTQVTLPAPS